jgi:hypothetical protein
MGSLSSGRRRSPPCGSLPRPPWNSGWLENICGALKGRVRMAERDVIVNQKQILENQAMILTNQQAIKDNQQAIKDNQQAIKENQKGIKKNQDTLELVLKNQQQILLLLHGRK